MFSHVLNEAWQTQKVTLKRLAMLKLVDRYFRLACGQKADPFQSFKS